MQIQGKGEITRRTVQNGQLLVATAVVMVTSEHRTLDHLLNTRPANEMSARGQRQGPGLAVDRSLATATHILTFGDFWIFVVRGRTATVKRVRVGGVTQRGAPTERRGVVAKGTGTGGVPVARGRGQRGKFRGVNRLGSYDVWRFVVMETVRSVVVVMGKG